MAKHLQGHGSVEWVRFPGTTTHSQLTEEQPTAGGITPELVRLSVGLEHVDDILADVDQALSVATA